MITVRPCQYCDLAMKSEQDPGIKLKADGSLDADWFCIATAARIAQLVYILDIYRAQISFPEQVKAIVREHRHWRSWKIGIESNNYQWALGQAVWDKGLPVVPVHSAKDKIQRAQMVTPHFETGRVRIRGVKEVGVLSCHPKLRRFEEEAMDFPFGDYDDVVDAVVGVVQMCLDDEIQGMQPVGSVQSGFAVVSALGGGRRRGDPFDVFKSFY